MNNIFARFFSTAAICGVVLMMAFVLPACGSDDSTSGDDVLDRNIERNIEGPTPSDFGKKCKGNCRCKCYLPLDPAKNYPVNYTGSQHGPLNGSSKSKCFCGFEQGCQGLCVPGVQCKDGYFPAVDPDLDQCEEVGTSAEGGSNSSAAGK